MALHERHHKKVSMDRVDIAVKNVIFQKEKSGEVVAYTPLKITEVVKRFDPFIHAFCLPQNEIMKETNDIYAAPKSKKQ